MKGNKVASTILTSTNRAKNKTSMLSSTKDTQPAFHITWGIAAIVTISSLLAIVCAFTNFFILINISSIDTTHGSNSTVTDEDIVSLQQSLLKLQAIADSMSSDILDLRYAKNYTINNVVSSIYHYTGSPGPKEQKGNFGKNGDPGEKGLRGFFGQPGSSGSRGLPGQKGDSGQPGRVGPKGIKGDLGFQGPLGISGHTGSKGLIGQSGPMGTSGFQGEQGAIGFRGIKGDDGLKGSEGNRGVKGEKGFKGTKGKKGVVGPEGPPGITRCQNICP